MPGSTGERHLKQNSGIRYRVQERTSAQKNITDYKDQVQASRYHCSDNLNKGPRRSSSVFASKVAKKGHGYPFSYKANLSWQFKANNLPPLILNHHTSDQVRANSNAAPFSFPVHRLSHLSPSIFLFSYVLVFSLLIDWSTRTVYCVTSPNHKYCFPSPPVNSIPYSEPN